MNQQHYGTMRRIILAAMIVLPFIPFVLALGTGHYYFTASIQSSAISSMKRIIEDHRRFIDSFLTERKANLEFILNAYSYEELSDPLNLKVIFAHLQRTSNAFFLDLGVFDEEGLHLAYQGPFELTGKIYKEAPWFMKVMEEGYYISDVFLGYRRIPHFVVAVKREDGGRRWIIRATVDTQAFNDLVRGVRLGKTGEAYLLNAEGVFQTERRSGGNLMERDPDSMAYIPSRSDTETFLRRDSKGTEYLYAVTWLKDKDWFLVVRQEKRDAFGALRSAAYRIILITLLGGVAIVGTAFYLTNRIIHKMEELDTEKDQLGQQLIRATRLAEVGIMATGFAHEINNPLQVMKSEQALMETILADLRAKGELKESEDLTDLTDSISQIHLQIERCSNITQGILKFGRKGEPALKDLDLKVIIPEVINMIEKKSSVHGITLKEEISEDIPFIHGDAGQMQQVLMNLLNNALDAIIERHGSHGGLLEVGAFAEEDGRVGVFVKDNGTGISPENLEKIFLPFFTTKPVGKGTGLGLSVCYGIVDDMGGEMEVSSEKGVGSAFTIHLPAATQRKAPSDSPVLGKGSEAEQQQALTRG